MSVEDSLNKCNSNYNETQRMIEGLLEEVAKIRNQDAGKIVGPSSVPPSREINFIGKVSKIKIDL